jgi:hypothetical protein
MYSHREAGPDFLYDDWDYILPCHPRLAPRAPTPHLGWIICCSHRGPWIWSKWGRDQRSLEPISCDSSRAPLGTVEMAMALFAPVGSYLKVAEAAPPISFLTKCDLVFPAFGHHVTVLVYFFCRAWSLASFWLGIPQISFQQMSYLKIFIHMYFLIVPCMHVLYCHKLHSHITLSYPPSLALFILKF